MRRLAFVIALSACAHPARDNGPDAPGGGDDASPVDAATDAAIDAPPPPPIQVLRGVDRASAFSLTEAKTLHDVHGVKWTGVYIGGPCSAGSGWTKSLLTSMHDQLGWTFMPIYVGQQSSAICGANSLTASQGTTDGQAAVAKMQTFGWMPNRSIPVCLDLEAGAYSSDPAGARAYGKAWRDAVRAGGYLAYLYSNPTAINNLFDNNIKFDGAWPASWFYTDFASVKPEDLDQLGTRYTNKNRAWQYAGSFAVSGAGSVDGDTSDLLLAPEPGGTNN
jgi:hypothetical protein